MLNSTVVVLAVAVMFGFVMVAVIVLGVFAPSARVTPVGTLLNVIRIRVLLLTPELPFELWVADRNADAKPSVMIMEPCVSGTVRFVKIVAAPWLVWPERAPIAKLAMPGPIPLITVTLDVVKIKLFALLLRDAVAV